MGNRFQTVNYLLSYFEENFLYNNQVKIIEINKTNPGMMIPKAGSPILSFNATNIKDFISFLFVMFTI